VVVLFVSEEKLSVVHFIGDIRAAANKIARPIVHIKRGGAAGKLGSVYAEYARRRVMTV
jgi:hypothetical protein